MAKVMAALLLALCVAACAGGTGARLAAAPAWPPFATSPVLAIAMPVPAPPQAQALAERGGPEMFHCVPDGRLRLDMSADGKSAVARWNDGAGLALVRSEENGQATYVGANAVLQRVGSLVAWRTTQSVVVARGDTLSKLALALYGDMARAADIAAANAETVRDPNRIFVGQVLRLPASSARRCTLSRFED